mgnify:CR=1 FL=1
MKNERTPVIFRKWRATGEVTAIFPTRPGDRWGHDCLYIHPNGDTLRGEYADLLRRTRPTTPEEYTPLLTDLKGRGYSELTIVNRATKAMHELRRERAYKARTALVFP